MSRETVDSYLKTVHELVGLHALKAKNELMKRTSDYSLIDREITEAQSVLAKAKKMLLGLQAARKGKHEA